MSIVETSPLDIADFERSTQLHVVNQDRYAAQAMQDITNGQFFDAAVGSLGEAEAAKALNDSEAAKHALRMVGLLIGKDIEITATEIELMDLPVIAEGSSLLEIPSFIKWGTTVNNVYQVATSRDFLYPGKMQNEVRLAHDTEELLISLEEEIYSKAQAELIHSVVATACEIIKQSTPIYSDEKLELLKFAYKAAEFHELGEDTECDDIAYDSYFALIRACRFIESAKTAPYVYGAAEKLLDIAHYNDEDNSYSENSKAEVMSALHFLRGLRKLNVKEHNAKALRLLTKYPPIDWPLVSRYVELV